MMNKMLVKSILENDHHYMEELFSIVLNVEKTNVVINDLPRIIFDLQTDIIERKKFNRVKIS